MNPDHDGGDFRVSPWGCREGEEWEPFSAGIEDPEADACNAFSHDVPFFQ